MSCPRPKLKKDIEPFGHNFEAIILFKEYADKKDPLYVYKINDKRGKPDMPSFVLKTSTTKMTMALHMDKTGDHFLSKEFFFFQREKETVQRVCNANGQCLPSLAMEADTAGHNGSRK